MKVLLCIVIATLVVLSHQQWVPPTNMTAILASWKATNEPNMNLCMCQSGVKKDLLDGLFLRGEISDDPCFKCSLRCFAEQLQIISSSGIVNARMLSQQAAGVDSAIGAKCASLRRADMCDTMYDVLVCVLRILSGIDPYPITATTVVPVATVPSVAKINLPLPNIVPIATSVAKLNSVLPNIVNSKFSLPFQSLFQLK